MFNKGFEQFVESWQGPFAHPLLVNMWKVIPPHVYWGIWKERNNRAFRNEERSEEVVVDKICKFIVENMKCNKWRKLVFPLISWISKLPRDGVWRMG